MKVAYGQGELDFRDRALGNDTAASSLIRIYADLIGAEGMGGGLDFHLLQPSETVYADSRDETSFQQLDLYAFGLVRGGSRRFPFAARFGVYVATVQSQFDATTAQTDYISYGGRFELEPEAVLAAGDDASLRGFLRLAGGAHSTDIFDGSTDEDYDSSGFSVGVELGLRYASGRLHTELSYLFHRNKSRDSSVGDNDLIIPRLTTEFDGVLFSFGLSF